MLNSTEESYPRLPTSKTAKLIQIGRRTNTKTKRKRRRRKYLASKIKEEVRLLTNIRGYITLEAEPSVQLNSLRKSRPE